MSNFRNFNVNNVGHETISLINEFSHQILNNVCEFVRPVVHQINPNINITNSEEDYVNKYIQLERNDTENLIMLLGYLPGVRKDSLNISLNGTTLSISGKTNFNQTSSENTGQDWSYVKNRRYYRTYNVPTDTTSKDINVSYNDGVLKLVIKKHRLPTPNNVSINIEVQ